MFDRLIASLPFWFWQYRFHDTIPLGAFALVCFLIGELVRPYCRDFDWTDPTINHPFATQEMFPNWTLVLVVLCPVAVTALIVWVAKGEGAVVAVDNSREGSNNGGGSGGGGGEADSGISSDQRRLSLGIAWTVAHCAAHALQAGTVELAKVFAGRLRPDFLSRLRRAGYNASSTGVDWCSLGDNNKTLRDGRLSFPSGHSSTSFAAFALFSLFVATQLRVVPTGSYGRMMLAALCWILPFVVAISRTQDYRHNYDDIAVGGAIGVAAAWVGFHVGFLWVPLSSHAGNSFHWVLRPRYCYFTRTMKKTDHEINVAIAGEASDSSTVELRGLRR